MIRKHDGIDLVTMYTNADSGVWNRFLARCLKNHDVQSLKKALYGIQVGMDDLVKKKLNDEKMNVWFIRIQRSLENTAKQIFRAKYPSPLDDPNRARNLQLTDGEMFRRHHEAKKKRDQEFDRFIKTSSF